MSNINFDYEIVNGRKIRVRPLETVTEIDENGYFRRQGNHFTQKFGDGPDNLKAEPGRYRLIWAKLCHWSNRAAIVRELEGLEDVISANIVEHGVHQKNLGWEYVFNEGNIDPILGDQFLSEAYYRADDDYTGRTTVPALIDVKEKKVVNNDYNWLTNYFEVNFRPYHKKDAPELYPVELRDDINRMNLWLFDNINNAVYRCAFTQSKEGYWQAYQTFYGAMDVLERRLSKNRFLFGDYVTDSDIRLYVTLARLDNRYTFQLGHTKKRLVDYPNLWGYARELWQIPAFRHNTYFLDFANPELDDHGKYRESANYRFLKQIDFEKLWGQKTDRAKLSKDPEHKLKPEKDGGTERTEAGFLVTETEKNADLTYKKITSIPETKDLADPVPVVKNPEDIPKEADTRSEQLAAILEAVKKIPEKPDLEPEHLKDELKTVRDYIKTNVTDAITTALTTVDFKEFQKAYNSIFDAFDHFNEVLKSRRFLLGSFVTVADLELFVSLARFDYAYSRNIGPCKSRLVDYPSLWAYARDLYQIPAVYRNTDLKSYVAAFSEADEGSNYFSNTYYDLVLPQTDLDQVWKSETGRAALSEDPTHEFYLTNNRRFDR